MGWETRVRIEWWPQPKQLELLRAVGLSHFFEGGKPRAPLAQVIGYGGAAGGGKSDVLLMVGVIAALAYPGAQVGYFRRKYPELEGPGGAIQRSHEILANNAKWRGDERKWTFPTGSILKFLHAEHEEDVTRYQSQQFDVLLIDEATHFTEYQVTYLALTRNRLTVKMPAPICVLATNPGGIGHEWFKRWFIDSGPAGQVNAVNVQGPGGGSGKLITTWFLPARLEDNRILMERDPGYRERLEALPEVLRQQLLEGNWDTNEGAVFREFRRDKHVIRAEDLPPGWRMWRKFMAVDWGRAAPGCALWFAIAPDHRIYVYREFYFNGGHTRDMDAYDAAQAILSLEADDEVVAYRVGDPSMWAKAPTKGRHGKSIQEDFAAAGCALIQADNDRLQGVNRVHAMLKDAPDGKPWLQIVDTCRHLIRTLPTLPPDPHNPELVDTDAEDHAYDALRYGLMSRPLPEAASGAIIPGARVGKSRRRVSADDDEDGDGPKYPGYYGY